MALAPCFSCWRTSAGGCRSTRTSWKAPAAWCEEDATRLGLPLAPRWRPKGIPWAWHGLGYL